MGSWISPWEEEARQEVFRYGLLKLRGNFRRSRSLSIFDRTRLKRGFEFLYCCNGNDYGHGHTITTLALISSTAGMQLANPTEIWDTTRTHEGWKDFRTNPLAKTVVLKCLKPVQHKLTSQQLNKVSPPFENNSNGNGIQFPTIKIFE